MNERMSEAATARAQGVRALADRPSQRRSAEAEDAPRHARVLMDNARVRDAGSDDTVGPAVVGVASVVERGYEMWDMFGPYVEVVSRDAFDGTLADSPLVEFTLNHNKGGGAPMASTRNDTLTLWVEKDGDLPGLNYDARVDDTRTDVSDMLKALKRGDLAEASFKFRIVRGQWSPDYSEYRIEEVDLHGGDVTAANFGANPFATSHAREAAGVTLKRGQDVVSERDLMMPASLL